MNLVNALINAGVVAVAGLALAWLGKGQFEAVRLRFDAVDSRIDQLEQRLDGRIDSLGATLDGRIDSLGATLDGRIDSLGERLDRSIAQLGERLDRSIAQLGERLDRRTDVLQASTDAIRSDLTQIGIAVGVRPRTRNS